MTTSETHGSIEEPPSSRSREASDVSEVESARFWRIAASQSGPTGDIWAFSTSNSAPNTTSK